MKLLFGFAISLIVLNSSSFAQSSPANEIEKVERQLVKNREDSTTWNWELFNRDLEELEDFKVVHFGVFPVPKYDLAGAYRYGGGGSPIGNPKELYEKKLVYASFFAGQKEKNEVFFTIIVLTDTLNLKTPGLFKSNLISRNNPSYTAIGYIKTKTNYIEYNAFLTPSKDQYALVNARLFNLKYGNIILIAPQKDGSLRSVQLESPVLSFDKMEEYINTILEKDKIKKFFTNPGNI